MTVKPLSRCSSDYSVPLTASLDPRALFLCILPIQCSRSLPPQEALSCLCFLQHQQSFKIWFRPLLFGIPPWLLWFSMVSPHLSSYITSNSNRMVGPAHDDCRLGLKPGCPALKEPQGLGSGITLPVHPWGTQPRRMDP